MAKVDDTAQRIIFLKRERQKTRIAIDRCKDEMDNIIFSYRGYGLSVDDTAKVQELFQEFKKLKKYQEEILDELFEMI